jgi:hypothetical protein
MSEHPPHDTDRAPAGSSREPHYLGQHEMIVYEAIATVRRPMGIGDLLATTGLEEDAVRAAMDRLTDLRMITEEDAGVVVGPNDWDVRGAR